MICKTIIYPTGEINEYHNVVFSFSVVCDLTDINSEALIVIV